MKDTLRYCPVCETWHAPHGLKQWRCDKCLTGASLAVLWYFALFAVAACAFAAWFCFS